MSSRKPVADPPSRSTMQGSSQSPTPGPSRFSKRSFQSPTPDPLKESFQPPTPDPFQKPQETRTPEPVQTFKRHTLSQAITPAAARQVADAGSIRMIPDGKCQDIIREVASHVYMTEFRSSVWHKNVCGPATRNNLLYLHLASVHHYYRKDAIPLATNDPAPRSSGNWPTPNDICAYAKHPARLCDIPDFSPLRMVNLGYFDSLYYVVLTKIRELYQELSDQLEHGIVVPESNVSFLEEYPPRTAIEVLARLSSCWDILRQPQLVATLDAAVRLRNTSHWHMLLEEIDVAIELKDAQIRRADLLAPGRHKQNEAFLKAPGLFNMHEDSMDNAKLVNKLKSLHFSIMHSKRLFCASLNDRANQTHEHDRQHWHALLETEETLGLSELPHLKLDSSCESEDCQHEVCSLCKKKKCTCRCVLSAAAERESYTQLATWIEQPDLMDISSSPERGSDEHFKLLNPYIGELVDREPMYTDEEDAASTRAQKYDSGSRDSGARTFGTATAEPTRNPPLPIKQGHSTPRQVYPLDLYKTQRERSHASSPQAVDSERVSNYASSIQLTDTQSELSYASSPQAIDPERVSNYASSIQLSETRSEPSYTSSIQLPGTQREPSYASGMPMADMDDESVNGQSAQEYQCQQGCVLSSSSPVEESYSPTPSRRPVRFTGSAPVAMHQKKTLAAVSQDNDQQEHDQTDELYQETPIGQWFGQQPSQETPTDQYFGQHHHGSRTGQYQSTPTGPYFEQQQRGQMAQNRRVSQLSGEQQPLRRTMTGMEPPPLDGTWAISKDELYALLPELPEYATPGASSSPGNTSRVRKASFNFFGLGKGKFIKRKPS